MHKNIFWLMCEDIRLEQISVALQYSEFPAKSEMNRIMLRRMGDSMSAVYNANREQLIDDLLND